MSLESAGRPIQSPNEQRFSQTHTMRNKIDAVLCDAASYPSDPLNVFKIRHQEANSRGIKFNFKVDEGIRSSALTGVSDYSACTFAAALFDDLATKVGVNEPDLVDIEEENYGVAAWRSVVDTYVDGDRNNEEDIVELRGAFEAGRINGLERAMAVLTASVPLKLYSRDEIDDIFAPVYLDNGTLYEIPTKLDGVYVNYFYADDNPKAVISLKVEPV